MRAFADAFVDRLNLDGDVTVLEVDAGSGALTEVLFPRVKSLLATDFTTAGQCDQKGLQPID